MWAAMPPANHTAHYNSNADGGGSIDDMGVATELQGKWPLGLNNDGDSVARTGVRAEKEVVEDRGTDMPGLAGIELAGI